jgi:hypothetical protein
MLGGIVVQMLGITIYAALAAEFVLRFFARRPARKVPITASDETARDGKATEGAMPSLAESTPGTLTRNLKLMLFAMGLSTLAIFIRLVT